MKKVTETGITAGLLATYRVKSAAHLAANWPRLAHSRAGLDSYFRSRIKATGAGIGNVIIPTTGAWAGVPLWVNGYVLAHGSMHQIHGLGLVPRGRVTHYLASLIYSKDDPHAPAEPMGQPASSVSGYEIRVPIEEIA